MIIFILCEANVLLKRLLLRFYESFIIEPPLKKKKKKKNRDIMTN